MSTLGRELYWLRCLSSNSPIAGQGLNLGLRDSYHLAKIISNSLELGLDIGSTYVLRDYSLKRLVDKKLLIQATHRLNQLFSNNSKIIKAIRENGLKYLINQTILKKKHDVCYGSYEI